MYSLLVGLNKDICGSVSVYLSISEQLLVFGLIQIDGLHMCSQLITEFCFLRIRLYIFYLTVLKQFQ